MDGDDEIAPLSAHGDDFPRPETGVSDEGADVEPRGLPLFLLRAGRLVPDIPVADGRLARAVCIAHIAALGGALRTGTVDADLARGGAVAAISPIAVAAPTAVPLRTVRNTHAGALLGDVQKRGELLYKKRGLRRFSDLYALTKESFEGLEGFRDKKIGNLLSAIEKSKHITLERFLYALGIGQIGRVAARDLAAFGSLEKIASLTFEELVALENIGEVTARGILAYFADAENRQELLRLQEAGVTPRAEERVTEGVFSGQVVVLTGSLASYSRTEAQKLIESLGGTAASSVTNATTLVIAGEKAGSKLDKARKLGIPVIGEEEFLKMLE